ncbi:hypothetical protein [Brachyspira aalborgi]|uniref:hypothetical protein n=1 Tax=Brachyspira aalborgi TaxID=29522 RepID=UPI0018F3AFE6|nr:hypothetical protein [Brachyspira aalborgi]
MKLLKKITILLCFLSLIAFVSCSAEDKSGVKEKDNADGTEITGGGKSGNSGTGGSSGTGGTSGTGGGSGTGGTSETGGGSGTGGTSETGGGSGTGGTETTVTEKFHPPAGTYKDKDGTKYDTKITIEGENTKIEGRTTKEGTVSGFGFNITEWKKTTKDGKDILESVNATDSKGWGHKNISIVYYYDTQTLNITYDTALDGNGYSFIGTKQP